MSHCNPQGMCCGYGKDAMKTTGYDCVIIPGASKEADKADIKVFKDKPRSAHTTYAFLCFRRPSFAVGNLLRIWVQLGPEKPFAVSVLRSGSFHSLL